MLRIGQKNAPQQQKTGAISTLSSRKYQLSLAVEELMKKLACTSLVAASLACASLNAKTALFIGGWPNQLMVVDESTYQIVKRIEMKTDVPRSLALSKDHSKLIVATLKDAGI